MKIIWVDPLNTNPQFLNLMAVILREAGHDVHVCSITRADFPPPSDVRWVPFARLRRAPVSLKNHVFTTAYMTISYPLNWLRTIRYVRTSGVKALLVTTNLMMPRIDAWAMRRLTRYGLAPVVIVHRPYQTFVNRVDRKHAARYGSFYRSAGRILTMNGHTQTLIQKMDRRVEGRHGSFPHPHFQSLLNRFSADRELTRRLKEWADGAPVIAFLSNMRPEQGFDDLLSSLPSLDAQLADWRLLVVSSTVPRRRGKIVESHLAEFGFRERCWCRWEPYSYSDLKAYLDAASLVVTPYRSATQSGVLAMAAAAGLPAVATEVGGLPEMMHSGVNGELVPAENPARLAQAIVTVIGNLDRYRRGARACRDTLYSPRQAVAAIVDALRAVSG